MEDDDTLYVVVLVLVMDDEVVNAVIHAFVDETEQYLEQFDLDESIIVEEVVLDVEVVSYLVVADVVESLFIS